MITVKQNADVYEVSFPYDPEIVSRVKEVPGRWWIASAKMWTIPNDKLGFLLAQFKGTIYESEIKIISEEQVNQNDTLDPTVSIPDIDISKVPLYVKEGSTCYPHQNDFMKYAIFRELKGNMNGFLLADDQGLGKSLEAMNLAIYNRSQYKFQHCLILCCINSSKYNWVNDIKTHSQGKFVPYILGSRLKRGSKGVQFLGSKEKLEDLNTLKMYSSKKSSKQLPYFIIMNIEAIRYKEGRKYPIADRLIELINQRYINMIVIDEVHKNISPTSHQGKQLLRIKKSVTSDPLWLPMSGTPITKKPTDLFMPLRLVNAHGYNSFYTWSKEYCLYGGFGGYEIVGYKNIPRLKAQLQNNMLRRLKADVLDLPPKIYYDEYVDNTDYQTRLYERTALGIIKQEEEIVKSLNPLAKFLRLRQVNGNPELVDSDCDIEDSKYLEKNAKLQRLLELLEEIHERGEKVIIFSNWVESLRTLYKFVSKRYKTCCFTGTMKEQDRQKHKEVFMTNPNYTVMIGTFGALGTTHTLTAARNVIMYDEPWNPSDKAQAEDRCLVAGTKITTPNGYINIEDIKVGDYVFTHTGSVQEVVDCWSHEEYADLVEIRFYGNPEPIILTSDHKVLTINGWKCARDLRTAKDDIYCEDITACMPTVSDEIKITHISTGFNYERDMYFYNNHGARQLNGRKHPIPEQIELTDDFLFFCGYYLGDGCACKPERTDGGQIQLAGNVTTKAASLDRCKNWFVNNIKGAATYLKEKDGKGQILYLANKLFNDFISRTLGRERHVKHLPDWVYDLNKHQLSSFFEGLCASDGWLDRTKKSTTQQWFTSTTSALASGVWWIMSRLGYKPRTEVVWQDGSIYAYNVQCTIDPTYKLKTGRIRSIQRYHKKVTLYDITVNQDNSFYSWGTPLHNCYRIGTKESVNIYTLITRDTVDDRVHDILYTKAGISQFIVDGKLDIVNNPMLFKLLLSDTIKNTSRGDLEDEDYIDQEG